VSVLVAYGLEELPPGLGPTVATVGMFDGVHRGHQALLRRVVAEAAVRDTQPAAVTFDRHPFEVLRPAEVPPLLGTVAERAELLGAAGMGLVLVLAFTPELSQVTAEDFAVQVLFGALDARAVVVGENFRFGNRAKGDLALLAALGAERGVEAVGVGLHADEHGEVVSSTRVRGELARGDVRAAAESLGRAYSVSGRVVRGAGRGRALLGVPTANLEVGQGIALPAFGIYAGHLSADGGAPMPAAVNVGVSPQFPGGQARVEAHVLDFDGDLYGRHAAVSFEHRLRGEQVFPSLDELAAQMRQDVGEARRLLRLPSTARHTSW
jgi:riboflavin kinase/FMN adenylyltransferase